MALTRHPKGTRPPLPNSAEGGVAPPASLSHYVEAVASGDPTPGGGSAVAVVAAFASALGEMVCNLTFGRSAYAAAEPELRVAVERLGNLRGRFLDAAGEDEVAYRRYLAATGLPKQTEEERAARLAAVQTALVAAADVPLAVAAGCVEAVTILEPVARLGNRHAVSDAVVGALLAEAALRGALLNVRGNAALLRDPAATDWYQRQAADLEAAGRAAVADVLVAAGARGVE